MAYKFLQKIDMNEVPDWQRRERKWEELAQAVFELESGKTLPVEFDDATTAKRARNAVRDTVNLRAGRVVLRTRIVFKDDGKAILYLTKLF